MLITMKLLEMNSIEVVGSKERFVLQKENSQLTVDLKNKSVIKGEHNEDDDSDSVKCENLTVQDIREIISNFMDQR